jgi:hypothetical protein
MAKSKKIQEKIQEPIEVIEVEDEDLPGLAEMLLMPWA